MQGSVAITASPMRMDSLVFRQKLGLSVSRTNSVLGQSSSQSFPTARCLFGPPDPVSAKELVREVELKNSISFGKRFNFDIVNAQPFPAAKRMKIDTCVESEEENRAFEEEGYVWSECYDENFMALCNVHATKASVVGPNRRDVCLFYAPIIHVPSSPSSLSSPACSKLQIQRPETSEKIESASASSLPSVVPHQQVNLSPERVNNENNNNNNNYEPKKVPLVKSKRTSFSSLTKYTNRVLKHAVMKKPRKAIITDFLQMRRLGKVVKQNSKK